MIHLALSILAAAFLAAIGFMLLAAVFWLAVGAWFLIEEGWNNFCAALSKPKD